MLTSISESPPASCRVSEKVQNSSLNIDITIAESSLKILDTSYLNVQGF